MQNYMLDIMAENHEKIADFVDEALSAVVGQYATQQPPSNLQNVVELMGQVAEKRLTEELQGDRPDIPDPMDMEIQRLGKLDKHMDLQKRIQKHQADMASTSAAQQLAGSIGGGDSGADAGAAGGGAGGAGGMGAGGGAGASMGGGQGGAPAPM